MHSVVHKMKVGGADGEEERERQWERQICCA